MNKRRLLKMADFVETIPQKEFDIRGVWRETRCGSVGCAIGHAAHARVFRDLRLGSGIGRLRIGGNSVWFEVAAMELFDIPFYATTRLFLPQDNHNTPKQVARNLRKYVASNGSVLP